MGLPVTLILVPDSPDQNPQVLTIPTDQYEAVASVLLTLAREIAEPPEVWRPRSPVPERPSRNYAQVPHTLVQPSIVAREIANV
jgi:hypothetical protein